MNWLDILGALGGAAGVGALAKVLIDIYNARSNKTTIDLDNMNTILQEAIARHDKLESRFDEFQNKAHAYVNELREKIVARDAKIDSLEGRINDFEKVVNSAWKCDYPPRLEDCPVFKEYERRRLCEDCKNHKEA